MSFEKFKNSIDNCMTPKSPNDFYRNIEQAFINSQWENTTSLTTVGEQKVVWGQLDYFEKFQFVNMEVWVNSVVGQSSTGSKSGYDFIQLIFKDINHPKLEGRYYKINGEYYISYFDNRAIDVDANLSVRRCNEWMRIIDPFTGSIYKIPCVVDYDMSAPSVKVTNSIITPNNHAVVKVQQNAMTEKLFITNKRFILGGRPFRITGMQNATNQFINNPITSLMEIDLFLDEIWDGDNLYDGVADNGVYNYTINVTQDNLILSHGSTGQIFTNVLVNGVEVDRIVNWESSNKNVVTINENGEYIAVGEANDSAEIVVSLDGNKNIKKIIPISIIEEQTNKTEIMIIPSFTKLRETETISVEVFANYNGIKIIPENVSINIPFQFINNLVYVQNGNQFTFTCLKRTNDVVTLTFNANSSNPEFDESKSIDIKLTSLLG